jgi:hypothetical protein
MNFLLPLKRKPELTSRTSNITQILTPNKASLRIWRCSFVGFPRTVFSLRSLLARSTCSRASFLAQGVCFRAPFRAQPHLELFPLNFLCIAAPPPHTSDNPMYWTHKAPHQLGCRIRIWSCVSNFEFRSEGGSVLFGILRSDTSQDFL